MIVNVAIDPEVDTELDVIYRTLNATFMRGISVQANSILLNLKKLRSKKDLKDIERMRLRYEH